MQLGETRADAGATQVSLGEIMQVIEVAGVTLGLVAAEPPTGPLSAKHHLFQREAASADIALNLVSSHGGLPRDRLLFDSQSVWTVQQSGTSLLYEFTSPVFEPPIYKSVCIDADYTQGTLCVAGRARDSSRPLPHPLDAPLDQLIFSHHLAIRGHVELHCCTLVRRGKAVVLTGFSGAGKTTSARLWHSAHPEVQILSDDRVIVRREGEQLRVFGTPWCGEGQFALNASAPLGAIVFLQHGLDNVLTPIDPRVAARELYARTFPPAWNEGAVSAVLETVSAMAKGVPVHHFSCRADLSAVETLDRALESWLH